MLSAVSAELLNNEKTLTTPSPRVKWVYHGEFFDRMRKVLNVGYKQARNDNVYKSSSLTFRSNPNDSIRIDDLSTAGKISVKVALATYLNLQAEKETVLISPRYDGNKIIGVWLITNHDFFTEIVEALFGKPNPVAEITQFRAQMESMKNLIKNYDGLKLTSATQYIEYHIGTMKRTIAVDFPNA